MTDVKELIDNTEKAVSSHYADAIQFAKHSYQASYHRVEKNAIRMHKLGQLYRKQTPPAKRSMSAWLRFLKKHAPKLKGL